MVRLLGAFRRERNGLVADTMYYEGARYGLNYGVSLPTVRRLVRELEPQRDEAFARFLLSQQVRCLQLAAYSLAEPESLADASVAEMWFTSLKNSELAEEAAYALLSRSESLSEWMCDLKPFPRYVRYALVMAAARVSQPDPAWLEVAYEVAAGDEHRLLHQATVALWAQCANADEVQKKAVRERLLTLGTTPLDELLRDELSWRIL